jgi:hypothetical protein
MPDPLPAAAQEFFDALNHAVKRVPEQETAEQFRAFGGQWRLNLKHALAAAAKAVAGAATIVHVLRGQASPADFAGGAALLTLWSSFLDAIRQKMTALQYVACVAIAKAPEGVTRDQLKTVIGEFLKTAESDPPPWWLGLSPKLLADAKVQLANLPADPSQFIEDLKKKGWAEEKDGMIAVRSRNFTLGIGED